ncbi:MAG: hypothetical protein ACTS9Y_04485 [Methylophilus sp.]|uniref:hypothetical protein n=1 Tax=Methylophilus sp. TaxID=29541 RepID=UPI003FA0B482
MAFLALISVLSSSAWAFSPEVLFDDAVSSQAVMQDVHLINKSQVNSNADIKNAPMSEPFCDHACHISAHITAIETSEVINTLPKLDSSTYKIESRDQFTNPVLKSLYRPPALV